MMVIQFGVNLLGAKRNGYSLSTSNGGLIRSSVAMVSPALDTRHSLLGLPIQLMLAIMERRRMLYNNPYSNADELQR
jgi:hypothetical protein